MVDHKHIDMVSVSKTQIVCTVSARFRPEEVPQLLADTGQDWKITVVGSQNATHNPKLERGIIHTGRDIFDFDFKMLNDEFDSGTT